ncbi:hypothetical protein D3C76_1778970 [compost metagenome]
MMPGYSASQASSQSRRGGSICAGFWAPGHLGLMNGPSRWTPPSLAPGIGPFRYAHAASSTRLMLSREAVTVVARMVVVPFRA